MAPMGHLESLVGHRIPGSTDAAAGTARGTKVEHRRLPPPLSLIRDFLIVFPAMNIAIVSLFLAVGISISPAHILLSLFPGLAIAVLWNRGHSLRTIFIASILLVFLFVVAILLSVLLVDSYGDSRSYHGPAIIALSDGWNPFYDWQVCNWNDEFCIQTDTFIDHYTKAQWYISAEFYSLTGNLDAGKCVNFLMLFLSALVGYEIALSLLPDRRALSLMAAVAIAANPVAVAQLFSGYIDGILSSTFSVFVLLLIGYLISQETKFLHQSMLILMYLANLKFTGFLYAAVFTIFLAIFIYCSTKKFPHYPAKLTCLSMGFSIVFVGFNPYVTNTILEKNPFAQTIDIDSGASVLDRQADPEFLARNRFERFFISTFSVGKKSNIKNPEYVLPLSRWKLNRGVGVRYSGFGPLFSAIFIITIFQATRLRDGPSIALILSVLITIFSTSAGWWPRLAPQTWLVMCLVQVFVLATVKGALHRRIALTVLAAMIFNSVLVFAGVFSYQRRSSARYYEDLRAVRAGCLHVVVTDNQFGLRGTYNRRKLVDSLGSDDLVVASCEVRRENRIFGICADSQPEISDFGKD